MTYTMAETVLGSLLHDVGKVLQRAYGRIEEVSNQAYDLESTLCPVTKGSYTHKHVLFTNAVFDMMRNENLFFPDGMNITTVENIASYHHKPDSCSQPGAAWLCALGDRYSAGMDRREDEEASRQTSGRGTYRTIPLQCVFDELVLDEKALGKPVRHAYALRELLPEDTDGTIPGPWPEKGSIDELPSLYQKVWQAFWSEFRTLGRYAPKLSFRLYEEMFLGLLERYTWAVPSSTVDSPDISLYDHSRTTAAIAACLHRYHEAREELKNLKAIKDDGADKFRFLAGDLSGIQNTLFALQTQGVKGVNKILRARSFAMGAVTEAATLLILESLKLPLCTILQQAGGRFVILVPALEETESAVEELRVQLDAWLLQRYTGTLALNIALSKPFSAAGFRPLGLQEVMAQLGQAIEEGKQRPLATCSHGVLKREFPLETSCASCGMRPAEIPGESGYRCSTCQNEFDLGKRLVRARMIVWGRGLPHPWIVSNILGLELAFLENHPEEAMDRFLSARRTTSPPMALPWPIRTLANHIPVFPDAYAGQDPRYRWTEDDEGSCSPGEPKSFMHIAAESLEAESDGSFRGRAFLALLKADVDHLGFLFSFGLKRPKAEGDRFTLSRLAQLSRMMDLYFTGYLKGLLHREFPNTYTIYAGGDDLLLIGPWRQTLQLTARINETFRAYTGHNPNITLSAGLTLLKPNHPVNRSVWEAESYLEKAKNQGRNRVCALMGKAIKWKRYVERLKDAEWIHARMHGGSPIGTGFVHRILEIAGDAEAVALHGDVSKAGWRSKLAYHLARNIKATGPQDKQQQILDWLTRLGLDDQFKLTGDHPNIHDWRLPLSIALYRNRS